MSSPRANISASSITGAGLANGKPGRSIFHRRQWLSLARALRLSVRELEILQGIFDDWIDAAIAAELGISVHTVHTYLQRLYHKLGVTSRCALIVHVVAEHLALEATPGDGKSAGAQLPPSHG